MHQQPLVFHRPRQFLRLCLVLLLTMPVLRAGEQPPAARQTDFGIETDYQPLAQQEGVSGALPAGWFDESAWTKSNCRYAFVNENGAGFLRVVCPGEGRMQFFCLLPDLPERTAFRIRFRAKSPNSARLGVVIQESGNPMTLAAAQFPLTPQWQEYSAMLAAGPSVGKRPGLRLYAPGPGTVELASLEYARIPFAEYVPPTLVPTSRTDHGWMERFQQMTAALAKQKPQFVIMGDSITAAWEGAGREAWNRHLAPLGAAQFGISADRIEHLLWRVERSGLGKDFRPRVIALLIGVNNVGNAAVEDIALGMKNLLATLRRLSPESKILVLGVFPVGEKAADGRRPLIRAVNDEYAKLADNEHIFFYDFGAMFLEPDGSIRKETLYDFVHCTPPSYERYAEKLAPKVKELLAK